MFSAGEPRSRTIVLLLAMATHRSRNGESSP
jgi:hypothetical protein